MTTLVFLDTETTSLRPDRRVWEIGLILRGQPGQAEFRWFIDTKDLDLGNADLMSLKIGGYHERHPQLGGAEQGYAAISEFDVLWQVEGLTRGATIIGAVPNFDTEVLGARMRAHGICPAWHYHLVDVETLAAGALRQPPPWGFDDLLAVYGLKYDEADRHTALGDARMVRDLYDAVMTGGGPDGRQTPERRDERAKWTKDVAVILRDLTADPDYEAYRKAADFLDADPPTEPLPSLPADGTTQPT